MKPENDILNIMEQIKEAAWEAGGMMRSAYDGSAEIAPARVKEGHANFVTEYDRKVQDFLTTRLSEILPEAHFVGEENGKDHFTQEDAHGYTFVLDPIDGTSNFMHHYGPSVTSIGLFRDGVPYLGAIYNPWQDVLFSAVSGMGAFENEERIHSTEDTLSMSLVSIGTAPYYQELRPQVWKLGSYYLNRSVDLRRSGSAAWDLCMVASGRIGLFVEPRLQLWDYAAGAVILTEAGGKITDLQGRPLDFRGPSPIAGASAGVCRERYLPDIPDCV
ncbi:MAG: inositol monophosphatase [Eubacterium sp.]|nr:inositol monophosphatase [Eubacterium sp.]